MGFRFSRIGWVLVSLMFGCACYAQNSSSDASLATYGAGVITPISLQPTASGSSNSVDYSSQAALPIIDMSAMAAVPADVSYTSGSLSSQAGGEKKSAPSSTSISGFGGLSSGWNGIQQTVGVSGANSGLALPTASSGTTATTNGRGFRNGPRSLSALDAESALNSTSAMGGRKMSNVSVASTISANGSSSLSTKGPNSYNSQNLELSGVGGPSAAGSASYATDFPDSTENTGLLSPPDASNNPVFAFTTSTEHEFPDLSNHEFLRPTLHVEVTSNGKNAKEDLYSRIENRLREYQGEENPHKGLKNGLKTEKPGAGSPFESPFAKKPTFGEDNLTKSPGSGLNF